MKLQTRAIVGSRGNEHGAIVPPLFLSSTFETDPADTDAAYMYQRVANPTRTVLESLLAQLEGAEYGFAFATGMAATAAVFAHLESGDHVLVAASVYGGTHRYASEVFARQGVAVDFVSDLAALTDADFTDRTCMVFVETPTNPTLRVVDIAHLAALAHRHGALFVVDNTFMTPVLQRPLELGADVVVQSATKFLGGHSDLLAGVITTNDPALAEQYTAAQKTWGAVLDPQTALRLVQCVKTLPLRLAQQQRNAEALVRYFSEHPAVATLMYPGWYSAEERDIHARQADGIGAVLSLELAEGVDWMAWVRSLQIAAFAVSLGDVATLVCHPASSTHEDMDDAALAAAGLSRQLLRVAVGIEDVDDLIEDFSRAFEVAASTPAPESAPAPDSAPTNRHDPEDSHAR
ncbi:MAG: PLP-dependent aspartate aminotransferase family protein [Dermabacter sp.]|nr:PLP-dependent aspartate aminotransferase family protein [Dermabacter sp.]